MAGSKVSPLSHSQFMSFTITVFKSASIYFSGSLIKTTLATQNFSPTEKLLLLLPGLLFPPQEVPRQKREELSPPGFHSFWISNNTHVHFPLTFQQPHLLPPEITLWRHNVSSLCSVLPALVPATAQCRGFTEGLGWGLHH